MTWQEYENEVFEVCQLYFTSAVITRDVKIVGRLSGRKRQIDILIEEEVGGNSIKIVIDCKMYNKKVDIKHVESFIGMVDDIGAEKGLMVTEKGYTLSALKRAHNNASHIELDIYNLRELRHLQGETAIPYAGDNATLILAPFGWVVDATKRDGVLCILYERGLTIEEAGIQRELAYINFWQKNDPNFVLEDLIKMQEIDMYAHLQVKKIIYQESICRNDGKTIIRIAHIDKYPGLELTGFVEFKDFIFFCVWFSKEIVIKRNIRKLESLMKSIIPCKIQITKNDEE